VVVVYGVMSHTSPCTGINSIADKDNKIIKERGIELLINSYYERQLKIKKRIKQELKLKKVDEVKVNECELIERKNKIGYFEKLPGGEGGTFIFISCIRFLDIKSAIQFLKTGIFKNIENEDKIHDYIEIIKYILLTCTYINEFPNGKPIEFALKKKHFDDIKLFVTNYVVDKKDINESDLKLKDMMSDMTLKDVTNEICEKDNIKNNKNTNEKTDDNKCSCGEYYSNPKFEYKCSKCFSKSNPKKWKEFLSTKKCLASCIPELELDNFIEKNRIKGSVFKMLLKALENDHKNLETFGSILNAVKVMYKKKLGITADEAGKLYKKYRELNNINGGPYIGKGSDWRWQHLFAGLIVDKWNIKAENNGTVTPCYYGNFGEKPRGDISMLHKNFISSWMINDSIKEKKLIESRRFWLNSLPCDLKKVLI
jgi:hypothetical protein